MVRMTRGKTLINGIFVMPEIVGRDGDEVVSGGERGLIAFGKVFGDGGLEAFRLERGDGFFR